MKCAVYTTVMHMAPVNVAAPWEAPERYSAMDVACLAFLVLWKTGRLEAELRS
jgi:hypothetical protein